MKNKYLKGAHLSERKVRELLKLFAEDLTATQIANVTGISRITVNAYFKLIRTNIARYCEERNPYHHNGHHYNGNGHALESLENGGVTLPETAVKKPFYGIVKREAVIFTDKLHPIEPGWLYDWLKGKIEAPQETIEKHRLHMYCGIADFNNVRLHRVNGNGAAFSRLKTSLDDIDLFWGMLKSRLVKFRGLNGGTLYLHVKETEFRYNNRDNDIYEMLLDILHKQPLHHSKMVRS